MTQNVLVIELNEFNEELLQEATRHYHLPALAKVLRFPATTYQSLDITESGFLEPWVQWVSIHAGRPSNEHKIKHLGDVPDLHFSQCWEILSQNKITTGVWGVMNGEKREAANTLFFLPDPWTFTEKGFPDELQALLDLPRYVAKNYENLRKTILIKKAMKLLKFILLSKTALKILLETTKLLFNLFLKGTKHYIYISYFDYLSTLVFIQYKKKYRPDCTFIFLNSLAHLQHHHWQTGTKGITPEILYGLTMVDKLLGALLVSFPEDAIVLHNGLSQMNTNHEKPWVLYRQKDPLSFLKALNIPATHVEQHMTHDGHVFFADERDCEKAYAQLKSATLNGLALFYVEKNPLDKQKLFYQLQFTDELDEGSHPLFSFDDKRYAFFEHFHKIVTRTGRHIPSGTVLSNQIKFENGIYNHEFNQYLYHYLLPQTYPYLKKAHLKKTEEELPKGEIA